MHKNLHTAAEHRESVPLLALELHLKHHDLHLPIILFHHHFILYVDRNLVEQ